MVLKKETSSRHLTPKLVLKMSQYVKNLDLLCIVKSYSIADVYSSGTPSAMSIFMHFLEPPSPRKSGRPLYTVHNFAFSLLEENNKRAIKLDLLNPLDLVDV